MITHVAFYAGWPKAWAVFNLAKEVWETGEGDLPYEEEAMRAHAKKMVFPIGAVSYTHLVRLKSDENTTVSLLKVRLVQC